jgi:hypothetical protein
VGGKVTIWAHSHAFGTRVVDYEVRKTRQCIRAAAPTGRSVIPVAHFYFVVYPAHGAADKPVSEMTVSKDGKTIAAVRLDLPEPNPDGSYPFLESLPLRLIALLETAAT